MRARTIVLGTALFAVTLAPSVASAVPTTARPTTAAPATARPTTAAPTTALPVTAPPTTAAPATEYTVVAAHGVSDVDAVAAIAGAGGRVLGRNAAVGMYRVTAPGAGFAARASNSTRLVGAARRAPIGRSPQRGATPVERVVTEAAPGPARRTAQRAQVDPDPLDHRLWGLRMIRAEQARGVTAGNRRVAVGILDTGVDASHPDISPNFNWRLSRNFAADMTDLDGPCEVTGCLDPVGTDDSGHGTHVAGTIGAAANGLGVSGIAPNVSLVELKGGQDAGLFFLEPVVDALTYAADAGLDVVNMSFYLDPWLYNCTANPADTAEQQAEQRTIIAAMNRALDYAHRRGVTLVGSLGNEAQDLGSPPDDNSSPDYPPGASHRRTIDNGSCVSLPAEGPHVISVSGVGPSGRKADYSNYGVEQISLAAPGGWAADGLGTDSFQAPGNRILSTYPLARLRAAGLVSDNGNVVAGQEDNVVKDCDAQGRCGYYAYLQGTSMAAPHVSGVAALVVSRFGRADFRHPGTLGLAPSIVESVLTRTAAEHSCPEPRLQTYTPEGLPVASDAYCAGDLEFNGFYGYGIVDAYAAVTAGRR